MKLVLALSAIILLAVSHLAIASAPKTFEQAKFELRQKVYFDRNTEKDGDLYCGCNWTWVGRSGGRVDLSSCGYEVRAQENRAQRTG